MFSILNSVHFIHTSKEEQSASLLHRVSTTVQGWLDPVKTRKRHNRLLLLSHKSWPDIQADLDDTGRPFLQQAPRRNRRPNDKMNRSGHSAMSRSAHGLAIELSYTEMATDEHGMIVSKERKTELRKQHGFCVTCPQGECHTAKCTVHRPTSKAKRQVFSLYCYNSFGPAVPILLLEIKRSRFNPLGGSKKPRTFAGECLQGRCLRCHPELDPDRKSRISAALPAPSLHSSVSSVSFASDGGSNRSIGSKDGAAAAENGTGSGNNQHESQMRLRGRMPPRRGRSIRGNMDPKNPVQGVLPRNPPSRSLSDDGLGSSRHRDREPRRARRPKQMSTRSFSPTPPEDMDSFRQSGKDCGPEDGSKVSKHGTVDTAETVETEMESSLHPLDLLQASSNFSFDSSGSVAPCIPETTLEDVKKTIKEKKATRSTDLLAQCIAESMQENNNDIQLFCLDTIADEALGNHSFVLALIRHKACKQLSKIITRHFGDEKMVCGAFAALRVLTMDSEARKALLRLFLWKKIVEAMQCNISNAAVQCDGCAVLSNLAVDAVNTKVDAVDQSVIDVIHEAMKEHKNDESVVSGACFAFKNFTYEASNLRAMSRTEGLLDDLQAVLDRFDSIFEAHETLDSLYMALAEDASLEESIVATLKTEIQSQQGPETIVHLLDTLKMYSWSREVVAQCLAMLKSLSLSSDAHKAKLLESISLDQLRVCVKEFGDAKAVQDEMITLVDLFEQSSFKSNASNKVEAPRSPDTVAV